MNVMSAEEYYNASDGGNNPAVQVISETEILQYEDVVQNSGSVISEKTVSMNESEQVCSRKKQNININGSPDVPDICVP